jgi:hypothetical protein
MPRTFLYYVVLFSAEPALFSYYVISASRRVTSFRAAVQLNLPYPSLRPACLRSAYAADNPHPDQHPNGVGAGWMAGLPAAPFINLLSPLQRKSKTYDWDLPNPRATALFSYYVI